MLININQLHLYMTTIGLEQVNVAVAKLVDAPVKSRFQTLCLVINRMIMIIVEPVPSGSVGASPILLHQNKVVKIVLLFR